MKKNEKKLKEKIEEKKNNDNNESIQDLKNKIADIVINHQNTLKKTNEDKENEIKKINEEKEN